MYIIQFQNRDSVLVETLPTIYANRSRAMFELMDIALTNPKNQYRLIELDQMINYEE